MSRDSIFTKIRSALEPIADKADHPGFESEAIVSDSRLTGNLHEAFERNLKAVNGRFMDSPTSLITFLNEQGCTRGYCDPALMDAIGKALAEAGIEVLTHYDRANYEDYRFGITRATGAIAETGSIILDDALTTDRLAALSPWVHIAVLRGAEIHRSIPDALENLGPSRNVIWVTGPSKTADVEGILIEGVHGPGEQVAYLID